jgi:hypothetical protein
MVDVRSSIGTQRELFAIIRHISQYRVTFPTKTTEHLGPNESIFQRQEETSHAKHVQSHCGEARC